MNDVSRRSLRQLNETPVARLGGVGPQRTAALANWGVASVLDLLTTYPRRYVDRTHQVSVADLAVGEQAVVLAEVRKVSSRRTRNGRSLVELIVQDGSGAISVTFFNQPWRSKQLPVGVQALLFGKLDLYRGARQMVNPVVDVLVGIDGGGPGVERTGRIVPVYPASAKGGLTSWEVGRWVGEALRRAGPFADPLPEKWRDRLGLPDRTGAMRGIHAPGSLEEAEGARRRLAFDELFRLQLSLVLRKRTLERSALAVRHEISPLDVTRPRSASTPPTLIGQFLERLPFDLTVDQRKALAVIFADMAGPLPMHRLLQGDVGSGKTVVAVAAMLACVQGGHQGALMVPTEVLAEQHAGTVKELVTGLSVDDPGRLGGRREVEVGLLTSSTRASERARLLDGLLAGAVDLLVGTHALLTEQVAFRSLGLVIVDEQHRFGVEQRAALREKGRADDGRRSPDPDLLVMTATPIPRTAAMIVFGDLDMTVLRELPPGRRPVMTKWARNDGEEAQAWERLREEAGVGHRSFVVCPLVEGSERVAARSAVEELDRLRCLLPELRLGLLHGQMAPAEKEAAMAQFRSGSIQVLVATTVIEVGVDVPEATVMVVLDAERFGMAQLHQLRGRVGRGDRASWCFLLGNATSSAGRERLEAMEATTDGFELAEVDLRLRGEGTILAGRQKGPSDLKLASLSRDRELLVQARAAAEEIVGSDPSLVALPLLADELRLFLSEDESAYLFRS